MSITELFGSPFLLIAVFASIVFTVVFVYINYKMSEQDHKISSMLALISTMAQELDFFRNKIATKMNGNLMGGGNMTHNNTPFATNKLIEVSDEDEDDDEDDDEDMDESYSSNDVDDDEDEDESVGEDYTEHVKTLNIQLGDDHSPEFIDISETNKEIEDSEDEDEDDFSQDDIVSLNSNDIQDVSQSVSQDITRTIHLEETITNNTDLHFLKSLHINNEEDNDGENVASTNEYKKMSIQKLRSIAVEKGISTDVSKMKKNEIVNLLLSA